MGPLSPCPTHFSRLLRQAGDIGIEIKILKIYIITDSNSKREDFSLNVWKFNKNFEIVFLKELYLSDTIIVYFIKKKITRSQNRTMNSFIFDRNLSAC